MYIRQEDDLAAGRPNVTDVGCWIAGAPQREWDDKLHRAEIPAIADQAGRAVAAVHAGTVRRSGLTGPAHAETAALAIDAARGPHRQPALQGIATGDDSGIRTGRI